MHVLILLYMCLSRDAGFEGRGVAETAEAALASPYTTMKLAAQAACSFFRFGFGGLITLFTILFF